MTFQQKLSVWMLSGLCIWQASLTGSSNIREADNARRLLYVVAGGSAIGVLMRNDPK